MADDAPLHAGEKRFFSESLMVELANALETRERVSRRQIEDLNARRALTGEPFDRLLIREGIVAEEEVLRELSALSGIPFRHIVDLKIDPSAVGRLHPRAALRHKVMPLEIRGGVMTLACCRVPDMAAADALRMLLDLAVDWVLCTETDITRTIKHFYGLGAETIESMPDRPREEDTTIEGPDVSDDTADAGVIRFVNQVISEAIKMEATDIHIEPFELGLRLRYRIDGILQDIPIPKGVARLRKAISSCVKIMADMNIAERRKPQDGRIKVRSGRDEFDLRVSILPSSFGETVNLRILNRKAMFIELEDLGLTESQMPAVTYLSSLPHGVVLLTGPTGSGKTTTLYALLARINTPEVKIITVEDPIEYQIHGINQIQVHPQIGLNFASILRSILRHDPDIILIGEIRDTETADIAVRSALTGHLVFSTLHTNDAPSAVTRLADMGIEPYLISSCLEGAAAQRLVRRTCRVCREEVTPDDVVLEEIAAACPDRMDPARFFRGRGCPDCNFTGYRGRIGLFEIMILDDDIRSLIVHQRPSNEIRRTAIEHGLVTLRNDGWNRVLDGITTVDEVMRVARKVDAPAAKR